MFRISSTIGHIAAVTCLIASMFAFVPCGGEGLDSVEVAVASVVVEAEEVEFLASRRSVRKRPKRILGRMSICDGYVPASMKRSTFFPGKSDRESFNGSGSYLRI